jgi:hypothetical protein
MANVNHVHPLAIAVPSWTARGERLTNADECLSIVRAIASLPEFLRSSLPAASPTPPHLPLRVPTRVARAYSGGPIPHGDI